MRKLGSLLFLAILLMQVAPTYAQDGSAKCAERFGVWDEATERCVFSGGIQIKLDYPIEYADNPLIDNTVSEYYSAVYSEMLGFYSESGFGGIAFAPWALDIGYETFNASETIVSLKFNVYEFTGGAHGNSFFATFTFDTAKEKLLTLDDVFVADSDPWTVIGPMAEAQIKENLGADMADDTLISQGAGTNPANYGDFVLTEDSIIFYFEPYVVAAYAAGPQEVVIPYADIQDFLNPELFAPAEE
jgi:hypothetical protein